MKYTLEIEKTDDKYCLTCPMLSFNHPRTSSETKKAFCNVNGNMIKVCDDTIVQTPKWCPLIKAIDTCPRCDGDIKLWTELQRRE